MYWLIVYKGDQRSRFGKYPTANLARLEGEGLVSLGVVDSFKVRKSRSSKFSIRPDYSDSQFVLSLGLAQPVSVSDLRAAFSIGPV